MDLSLAEVAFRKELPSVMQNLKPCDCCLRFPEQSRLTKKPNILFGWEGEASGLMLEGERYGPLTRSASLWHAPWPIVLARLATFGRGRVKVRGLLSSNPCIQYLHTRTLQMGRMFVYITYMDCLSIIKITLWNLWDILLLFSTVEPVTGILFSENPGILGGTWTCKYLL